MERRRKTAPRITEGRLDPTAYDASPFAVSMYPNIDEFTEHGQIVIGHIEPLGGVAIATATIDNVYVDEVNTPRS